MLPAKKIRRSVLMKMKENKITGLICRIAVTALASVFIAGSNVRVNVALAAEGGHKNMVSQMISSRAVDLKTKYGRG